MSQKKNILLFGLSILLHVALVVALIWNYAAKPEKTDNKFVDAPVQARLVTAPERSKKDATSLKKKNLQRQKELEKIKRERELKKQKEQQLEQQKQEQEKLEKAEKEKQEKQEKENLEKAKKEQEQQKKKAEEQAKLKKQKEKEAAEKKKREALEKKKREAEAKKKEAERKKKEAEAKKKEEIKRKKAAEEKKKREEAARKAKELADLEASLEDELFNADKGAVRQSQIMSEVDKLKAAIRTKVMRNWYIPDVAGVCKVSITIGPGGVLLDAKDNGGDVDYCDSGKLAIQKAAPLPSSDDPAVMKALKKITITFDPTAKE